jgi:hypothetical protein
MTVQYAEKMSTVVTINNNCNNSKSNCSTKTATASETFTAFKTTTQQ